MQQSCMPSLLVTLVHRISRLDCISFAACCADNALIPALFSSLSLSFSKGSISTSISSRFRGPRIDLDQVMPSYTTGATGRREYVIEAIQAT